MPRPSRFGALVHVSRFVSGPPRACPSDSPRPTSQTEPHPARRPAAEPQRRTRSGAQPDAPGARRWSCRKCACPEGFPSPSAARGREPTCPSAAAAMIRAAVNCARPGVAPEKNVPAPPCSHPLPRDGRPSLPASQARPGSPTTERLGAGPCCRAHAPQVHPFPLAAAAARGGSQERPGAEDSGHHGPRVPADLPGPVVKGAPAPQSAGPAPGAGSPGGTPCTGAPATRASWSSRPVPARPDPRPHSRGTETPETGPGASVCLPWDSSAPNSYPRNAPNPGSRAPSPIRPLSRLHASSPAHLARGCRGGAERPRPRGPSQSAAATRPPPRPIRSSLAAPPPSPGARRGLLSPSPGSPRPAVSPDPSSL